MKCRKATYSIEVDKIADIMRDNAKDYYINTIYPNKSKGGYWYENSKGYVHALFVQPMRADGQIMYYAVRDALLQASGKIKIDYIGMFKTAEETEKAIQNYFE